MMPAPDANSLSPFIGKPWVAGARGPNHYDCWGLFLAVQKQFFNRDLPEIPLDALNLREVINAFTHHPERQRWQRVSQTRTGDAVLMRQSRYPAHIGVWLDIDGGGILHSVQHSGVVYQTTSGLYSHGWRIEGIYQFTEKPTISEQNVNDR
ncbi:NlpC/P60 family protein [Marinobacterium sp. xm-a-152]|uniref:NlpC/P60 family protein n=1 Tax=Marinobacterium sp. xm-a-152 TaxID=2497733 RepID=UPI0019E3FA8A|nr:NlpC/P60 family protein [Marinobacterium sp. xm-a-152]NRP15014.1 NlpC/P60 family protein [Marinobacterium sp. xm-a-152]